MVEFRRKSGKEKLNFKKKILRTLFIHVEKFRKEGKNGELSQELEEGLAYIQMRLPIKKITKEYEQKVKAKVEHNIFNAKIREATEKDLETIKNIYNKAWLTSNTPFRPIDINTLKIIHEDPDTVILIARVYGIDAGFVIIDLEGENKEYGVIAGLGILPRFQRKGLGTVLGLAAWNYLKNKGIKEIRCEVYKENKASYNFIKGLQFEEFGEKVYKREDFEFDE
ncbi:MAG: GNAT family N-acetyltransferase [Promethearchaeota archaeon]